MSIQLPVLDFLARNREKLVSNHRLGMIYRTYDRMSDEKRELIKDDSQSFLEASREKETDLPTKICPVCRRAFRWRKKWEKFGIA